MPLSHTLTHTAVPDDLSSLHFVTFLDGFTFDDKDADSVQGFVITGGEGDSYSSDQWVVNLREFIQKQHQRQARMLGVCFGHQVIAHSLGGKAEKGKALELGVRTVEPTKECIDIYGSGDSVFLPANIIETHGDQVVQLPTNGVLLGSSPNCPIEAYQIPAGPEPSVLCFQGHPEFPLDFTKEFFPAWAREDEKEVTDEALKQLDSVPDVNPPALKQALYHVLHR